MTLLHEQLLALLRLSIHGTDERVLVEKPVDWEALYSVAKQHAVIGLTLEGVSHLKMSDITSPSKSPLDTRTLLKWYALGEKCKATRETNTAVIAELAAFYREHGIHMMLLKGYGLSLYWPRPETRPSGDVDIYLFDDLGDAWQRGDKLVAEKMGKTIRCDSEHHTKFSLHGISIENHYDFVNTKIRKSSARIERLFKSLAKDHSQSIWVEGQEVYVPSDKLNALFLLRHLAGHFASEGLNLRQVLDWAFFVSKAEMDWDWLYAVAMEYNMHRFLSCLNAICVENLGFDANKLPVGCLDKTLKDRVLQEFLAPLDLVPHASTFNKVCRWWKHRWKHRICYSDSMFSSFWTSVSANMFDKSIKK